METKIKLNVGGMKFSTSLETLLVCQDSMLAAMFSGRFAADPDTDGEFFIDRNGKPFRYRDRFQTPLIFIQSKVHSGLLTDG